MPSRTYTAADLDNPVVMAEELLSPLPDQFPPDTVGFFLCDSQAPYEKVLAALHERLPFPVIGGTALSFPVSDETGGEISASLTLLSKPGLAFATVASQELDHDRADEQMQEAYERCLASLGADPKLILCFFPLMPGVITDRFIASLFARAGGVPVFGGITTNDLISTKAAVFFEGKALTGKMVMMMLGGAIRPVFAAGNKVTNITQAEPVVTRSKGNTVFSVNDTPLCDYMASLGIAPEDRVNGVDALMQYGPIPVEVKRNDAPDDDVPEVRCISFTNLAQGSATFSGAIPEGARLGVSLLTKEDVVDSAKQCLGKLKERMAAVKKNADYTYDCMLCVSCVARYFVLTGSDNVERRMLTEEVPSSLALSGYYGFCEIGPTVEKKTGKIFNRSHSASIAMCAL